MSHHNGSAQRIRLGTFIEWCGGSSQLGAASRSKPLGELRHDSRLVRPGDVFIALKTENNDGHAFIESACKAGALAVVAARRARFDCSARYLRRVIRVTDPLAAVQRAARRYRRELGYLCIGITGSSGKTTTRSFISAVLAEGVVVGETYSNWNNHLGVPLSLLRFTGKEWAGVIEMGANHTGEISILSRIAQPDIAVITNIGYAHVGLFGSLAKTTSAKFEIAEGLNRKNGFLLLNGDDSRLVAGCRSRNLPAYFYGYSKRCSVRPEQVTVDVRGGTRFTVDGTEFVIAMPGRHFVYSALPAVFLGRRCGIPDELIARALAAQRPVALRGTLERKGTIDFIVDCYNANPTSMEAALVYLTDVAGRRRKIAVVGEMMELGRYAGRLHRQLGKNVARSGVARLIAVGEHASAIIDGAREAGMGRRSMIACSTAEETVPVVNEVLRDGDTVLLKASRGIHLETVFEGFGG
ncbi:MAG: UDP-N-acetylmuramoyl-tripeptide--D-alanyl-D-alanine ligase [Chitinispirillaceae bacterium]|nr:UDP-N-acetylmuramoyl-tripeptide--D-alanyl-D-alanine ligase [Chitinispirillaceae bacterium]